MATIDFTLETDQETYQALMSLTNKDIANAKKRITASKEDEILKLKVKAYYYNFDGDLQTLQGNVEGKYLEKKFSEWKKPETQKISTEVLQPLPSLKELGLTPMAYATKYRDEEVFAYPGIVMNQVYDASIGGYKNEFSVTYFRLQEEAQRSTGHAQENKQASDAKIQRELDRKDMSETARNLLNTFTSQIETLRRDYEQMGFTYSELRDLEVKYENASRAIDERYTRDTDPRRVITILWEISDAIEQRTNELEKRKVLLPEVEQLRDEVRRVVDEKLTYEHHTEYGMSYDEYSAINDKWREANDLLEGKSPGWSSTRKMVDPEGAGAVFEGVETLLSGKERQVDSELARIMREVIYGKNSIAQLVTVEGGIVTSIASPRATDENDVIHNPVSFSIGKSGRELLVSGNKFTYSWGGRDAPRFQLNDGIYVIGRDAATILRVEKGSGGELKPIERTEPLYEDIYTYIAAPVYRVGDNYSSVPFASAGTPPRREGMGTLAELLSAGGKGKQEKSKKEPEPEKPKAPKPEVKEEEMTEEKRKDLLLEVEILRVALEESLKGLKKPTVKGAKPTDKEKAILALIDNAVDCKRQLGDVEREINSPDARVVSIRGKIASTRGSISSNLNKNLALLVDGYSKDWMTKYQTTVKAVEAAINGSTEATEFITEEITTRDQLVSRLKDRVKGAIPNLQRGQVAPSMETLLEDVLGSI